MFFRRRRHHPLVAVLLFILGVKWLKKGRSSDVDHEVFRAKKRSFKHKLHEAFAVWDDTDEDAGVTCCECDGECDGDGRCHCEEREPEAPVTPPTA